MDRNPLADQRHYGNAKKGHRLGQTKRINCNVADTNTHTVPFECIQKCIWRQFVETCHVPTVRESETVRRSSKQFALC